MDLDEQFSEMTDKLKHLDMPLETFKVVLPMIYRARNFGRLEALTEANKIMVDGIDYLKIGIESANKQLAA